MRPTRGIWKPFAPAFPPSKNRPTMASATKAMSNIFQYLGLPKSSTISSWDTSWIYQSRPAPKWALISLGLLGCAKVLYHALSSQYKQLSLPLPSISIRRVSAGRRRKSVRAPRLFIPKEEIPGLHDGWADDDRLKSTGNSTCLKMKATTQGFVLPSLLQPVVKECHFWVTPKIFMCLWTAATPQCLRPKISDFFGEGTQIIPWEGLQGDPSHVDIRSSKYIHEIVRPSIPLVFGQQL